MTPPTSYTETTLADYLATTIGIHGTNLGWVVADGDYTEVITEIIYQLNATTIETFTDLPAMRAVGRYQVWLAVLRAIAGDRYDFKSNETMYNRSQVYKQVKDMVNMAENEVFERFPEYLDSSRNRVYMEFVPDVTSTSDS